MARFVPFEELAAVTALPAPVLSYLHTLAGVRAVRLAGGVRALKFADAQLVAGLAVALYQDGMAQRDVRARLAAGASHEFRVLGAPLLGGPANADGGAATRPIPADAATDALRAHRPLTPQQTALLSELNACLRILQEARGPV